MVLAALLHVAQLQQVRVGAQGDKAFMLVAVERDSMSLMNASEEPRNDKEVVIGPMKPTGENSY